MENLPRLSRSPVFEDISLDDIHNFCAQGREVSFPQGHVLFVRGQDANELMLLNEGCIELFCPMDGTGGASDRDIPLESKNEGDLIAWSALVKPHIYTLGARCVKPCNITTLERKSVEEYFEHHPQVGYLFMRNLAGVAGSRLNHMFDIWVRDLRDAARA